jgi:hypothetical protein
MWGYAIPSTMVTTPDNNLDFIKTTRKSGDERFIVNGEPIDVTLSDFWRWGSSDLLGNTNRGFLAEFIVANALGIAADDIANEWAPYDLEHKGIKIEVKSGAYVQSWTQKEYSRIVFGIAPRHAWDPKTNKMTKISKRQSNVYVFCVLKHKDKDTIDPMNLDQWEFYILPTKVLDEKRPGQKTITLGSLKQLGPVKVGYGGIREAILNLCER